VQIGHISQIESEIFAKSAHQLQPENAPEDLRHPAVIIDMSLMVSQARN
jgi:hypothetical protein